MGEKEETVIKDSIELRTNYDELIPKYKRLVNLVSVIINTSLESKKIKIHSLKQRIKDYNSFLEKVDRKRYGDPFKECTDLAGCRIVCLFLSQVDALEKIIDNEFDVVEVSDKRTSKKFDQFGYVSLHMLVKLKKKRTDFVEYSDLKDLVCEIQIRTILQEAWAEIEHYLNYKATKEEKREDLLRKIFSLAGMFEVADSTFEEINSGFSTMIKEKIDDDSLTSLSLFKLSKQLFPEFSPDWDKIQERRFYQLNSELKKLNLNSISKLKAIISSHKHEIKEYIDSRDESRKDISPVLLIRAAMSFEYGKRADFAFGLKNYSESIKRQSVKENK